MRPSMRIALLASLLPIVAGAAAAWPTDAAGTRIKGYVIVRGTVAVDGSVTEVAVVRSQPAGLFDALVLDAVRAWRFEPRVLAGKPVTHPFVERIDLVPGVTDTLTDALLQRTRGHDDDLVPLMRIEPQWPRDALVAGISGKVRVRGIVKTDGTVRDVTVVRSTPPGVFDRATVAAVSRWTFKPRVRDGVPVEREFTQTVSYSMAGDPAEARRRALVKLVETKRPVMVELFDRVRGLCPDLYPRADDAVNMAFATAALAQGIPDYFLADDAQTAEWQLEQPRTCLFSSWEQLRDPAAIQTIVEFAPIADERLSSEVREALTRYAALRAAPATTDLPTERQRLQARAWILDQMWDGYLELLFAHSKQFTAAPPTGKAAADALDRANDHLARLQTAKAVIVLQAAMAAVTVSQDRALLALAIARIEAANGRFERAVAPLAAVEDLDDLPWNLRQAVRLALARFSAELGDAKRFDAELAAVNAELAVGDRLTF